MEIAIVGALTIGFLVTSIIMPWVNRAKTHSLQAENQKLAKKIKHLAAEVELLQSEDSFIRSSTPNTTQDTSQFEGAAPDASEESSSDLPPLYPAEPTTIDTAPSVEPAPQYAAKTKPRISLEEQFATRLPVWIGGIAIILAALFLVKYSLDNNLLSPAVRVLLGTLTGMGALFAAHWVHQQPTMANGERIGQALAGTGVAILYISTFAAASLYGLIPNWLGFMGLAATTSIAVVLSVRHGPPIAVLGLLGGLVTPALVSSNSPSATLLFAYLYILFAGLLFVAKRQGWWWLSLLSLVGSFGWVGLWMLNAGFGTHVYQGAAWPGLFLLAITATSLFVRHVSVKEASKQDDNKPEHQLLPFMNYLSLGGSLLLLGALVSITQFSLLQWGLFGILSLGGIGLAYFRHQQYWFVPWVSLGGSIALLAAWQRSDIVEYSLVLMAYAAMFMLAGYSLLWRLQGSCQHRADAKNTNWEILHWAGLAATASLGFYLLAYFTLRSSVLVESIPLFWGFLALGFTALGIYILQQLRVYLPEHPLQQQLLAIFAVSTTAFLAIGVSVELPREFLSVAIAIELLAVAWLNHRFEITALRPICCVLALVFGWLLLPQLVLLSELTLFSLIGHSPNWLTQLPIVDWPLFQLGLPAILFAGAAYFLHQQRDGYLVNGLEVAVVALLGIMGYYLTRHALYAESDVLFKTANFAERGIITNTIFVYGLACAWLGHRYGRTAVLASGGVLFIVGIFRIAFFDLLTQNPLWTNASIAGVPLFNTMLLPYGLPIVWLSLVQREVAEQNNAWLAAQHFMVRNLLPIGMLILIFTLISLNIRFVFHGTNLDATTASNTEIYSYSVVWLLLGLGVLLWGAWRQDQLCRYASLVIMLSTVGKVFLYDASELEGLFRVFSFFGLGLSLIGLSWFYARFGLKDSDEQSN